MNKRALEKNLARVEKALPENHNQAPVVSCGKPLDGNVVRIVDPHTRQDLGEGRIGEVWVDGASKGGGYWRCPEKTAETFEARIAGDEEHTYLRTGDLGFLYEGELFVCGRTKDLIIVRGVNCYPSDIEAVVERSASQVRDGCVAAFSVENADQEALVVVAEVRDEHALPDAKALARAIRRHCHVDPHTIVFVPPRSIPKTTSGKIRRAQTRQLWLDKTLPVLASHTYQSHEAPMPPLVRWTASATSSKAMTSPAMRTARSPTSASTRWPWPSSARTYRPCWTSTARGSWPRRSTRACCSG
ncbi:AMP-binding enzyme family protein [Mycobacterium xenopi 4042]|uniref:AMP-binding enzyme family protein n=1 Tax=Mycobacterium xenopi 4042 TaxID=1299334 RepID=X8CES4_MYCXE|nr:AMP-binding enzyme family protein [Mycobacterium xenopi 4042]